MIVARLTFFFDTHHASPQMPLVLALWPLNSISGIEPCLTTLPTSDGTVQWQGFLSVLGEQPKRCSLKVKESSHLTLLSSPTQKKKRIVHPGVGCAPLHHPWTLSSIQVQSPPTAMLPANPEGYILSSVHIPKLLLFSFRMQL